MGHRATGCILRTDGHSSVRAARRQADEEKQEDMRLARESAEYAQDPDAADFMSSAIGARPASQASQPPPRPQPPRQPAQPPPRAAPPPRATPQHAPAPPPTADAYGGDCDFNPMPWVLSPFVSGLQPCAPGLQPYAPQASTTMMTSSSPTSRKTRWLLPRGRRRTRRRRTRRQRTPQWLTSKLS